MAKTKTSRYYFYYLLKVGVFLVGLLPIRVASCFGWLSGRIGFLLLRKERKRTLKHLRYVFPSKSDKELWTIAKGIFSNIVSNFTELTHIHKLNKGNIDKWVTPHGLKRLDNAFLKGKGVIVLTAHFGNWELVGAYMRMKGYEGATIVRKLYFHKYDKFLSRIRMIHDVGTVYRDESPKKMLRYLRDNKVLGMLADQDIKSIDGIFVDFLGRPAYTPVAPVKIAMASGAPIIPCYMIRNGGKYEYFVDEPIYVKAKGDKKQAIKEYTQKWSHVLETYIRKYPDQWVWMHRRWKTKPNAETSPKAENSIVKADNLRSDRAVPITKSANIKE